ncbi:hypothetical protein HK104_010829, partial [Borealophlyctis nickersoniae]
DRTPGNKAATFPLQVLGFDVDPINTVHLSNHNGYPTRKGEPLEGEQLAAIIEGLEANEMLGEYTHLLTGYIGRASCLHLIADLVPKLKRANPSLTFLCDPVLGDNGKLYVSADLIPLYRDVVCPLADIITPNAFEVELLTGICPNSTATALQSTLLLHQMGIPTVIITSMTLQDQLHNTPHLYLFASHQPPSPDGITPSDPIRATIAFPKLEGAFTGTGDLASALLLAYLGDGPTAGAEAAWLKTACERAVGTIQGVLQETVEMRKARGANNDGNPAVEENKVDFFKRRELAIVQSRKHFEEPRVVYRAEDVRILFR